MNREQVLHWFEDHPAASRGDAREIVDRCERAVRRHAMEDAWIAAKAYVLERAHRWEREWSPPASEEFVAPEICHQLAFELRRHEPTVERGAEDHLAGQPVMEALTPEGWTFLGEWVREVAVEEEHRVWQEIVRYTDRRARRLARERHLSSEWGWDEGHRYTVIAARIAEILAREYSVRAHPR